MQKHIIQIRLEVESADKVESLAKFYNEIVTGYEGTEHKTTEVSIAVDGAFLV